jgi:hypothetical protein
VRTTRLIATVVDVGGYQRRLVEVSAASIDADRWAIEVDAAHLNRRQRGGFCDRRKRRAAVRSWDFSVVMKCRS